MSTYYSASICIKIPEDNFDWLNPFIKNIYSISDLYVQPLDEQLEPGTFKLEQKNAYAYFEHYIKKLQATIQSQTDLWNNLPSLSWSIRDSLSYEVVLDSEPGYLRWTIYLLRFTKVCKEPGEYDADFEYYLRKQLEIMYSLPVIEVWAGCDEEFGDPEWFAIDGNYWSFQLKNPEPEESFQMLSILLTETFCQDLLIGLIEQADTYGYRFFPNELLALQACPEKIIENILKYKIIPEKWTYVCENRTYNVYIIDFGTGAHTRILFQTPEAKNTPSLSILVDHALALTSPYVLDQIRSFDSRYNYFSKSE